MTNAKCSSTRFDYLALRSFKQTRRVLHRNFYVSINSQLLTTSECSRKILMKILRFEPFLTWNSFLSSLPVVPAVLGLTLAAILAVAACFCARRLRRQNKKSNPEAAFPFQPPPKPTRAVRSPSGVTSHYLKKSPSPTSIKPLPGLQSPTTDPLPPQTLTTKYSAESEVAKCNELNPPDQEQVDCGEYGKLGTLVFKLRYLVDRKALVVSVIRCRGLPSRNMNGSMISSTDSANIGQLQANGKTQTATATDPYVKLQLLPDKQHKVKTR